MRIHKAGLLFFFFRQKTANKMRISDWSSDVCSSDLTPHIEMKSFHRRIDADLKPVPGWPDEQATAGNDRVSRHVVGFELDPHRIAEMHDDQMIIGRIHLRTERRFILLGEKEA